MLLAQKPRHPGKSSMFRRPKLANTLEISAFLSAQNTNILEIPASQPENFRIFRCTKYKHPHSEVSKKQKSGKYLNITQSTSQGNSTAPTKRFFMKMPVRLAHEARKPTSTAGHSKHTNTNLTQKYFQGVILQNYENKLYENKFSENYLQKITHSARNSWKNYAK